MSIQYGPEWQRCPECEESHAVDDPCRSDSEREMQHVALALLDVGDGSGALTTDDARILIDAIERGVRSLPDGAQDGPADMRLRSLLQALRHHVDMGDRIADALFGEGGAT